MVVWDVVVGVLGASVVVLLQPASSVVVVSIPMPASRTALI